MPGTLRDWPRKHYQEPGGKPFLFFVVYGAFGGLAALDSKKYRSAGMQDGLELSHYDKKKHPGVLGRFQEGYLWVELQKHNPKLAEKISVAPECLVLQGEIDDTPSLNYLRDSVGLLTFLLDNGGITIFDPSMFHWWEPKEWRERIFDPAGPVPRHHVVILISDEPSQGDWFHTRGMRKFGRPDLSIHNVPVRYHKAVIDLCERFIEFQAFGGLIEEGQEIRMKGLPAGMTCRHQGDLEDPDFNNVHAEIVWRRKGK